VSAAFTTNFRHAAIAVLATLSVSPRDTTVIPKNQRREKGIKQTEGPERQQNSPASP
jgi:hypothetical protein